MKCILFLLASLVFAQNPVIQAMAADTWLALPNTKIRPLCPSEASCTGISAIEGCGAVVWSWSGGTFDTGRNRVIVWGGGHSAYMGNEVYGFDLDNLTWARIFGPTCPVGSWTTCQDPLWDGNPNGRHTYDGLAYIAHADVFFGFGGSLSCAPGNGTRLTWAMNLATNTWTNRQPAGSPPGQGHTYCLTCAYDPQSQRVYMRDPYNFYYYEYTANRWTTVSGWDDVWGDQTSTIDTKRRLYFAAGSGSLLVWDLANNRDATASWTAAAGSSVISAPAPGFKYDPVADRIVAWAGGAAYVLNLDTKVWTKKAGEGVAPSRQAPGGFGGSYGRFAYSPKENAFVLVSAVDDNVWIYKHTAGGGTSAESAAPRLSPVTPRQTEGIYDLGGRRIKEPGRSGIYLVRMRGKVIKQLHLQ